MTHRVEVQNADVLSFPCDVLVLKHAQALYGADLAVVDQLAKGMSSLQDSLPDVGGYAIFQTYGMILAKQVIFIGTRPLTQFSYEDVWLFARQALEVCASEAPQAKNVGITLHGANTGLDEREALYAEVIGLNDAISEGLHPKDLELISVIERNARRADRLRKALQDMALPSSGVPLISNRPEVSESGTRDCGAILSIGGTQRSSQMRRPGAKPSIFVAMPFMEEMTDVFYYGIQNPIEQAGYLCERADLASFTGDVMNWVRDKISSSRLVVAELTGANPNVYLEIGFAWGIGKPTALLARAGSELKFDVRGQRCLLYDSIKDLEGKLASELRALLNNSASM